MKLTGRGEGRIKDSNEEAGLIATAIDWPRIGVMAITH
jgi:hypothetical protein